MRGGVAIRNSGNQDVVGLGNAQPAHTLWCASVPFGSGTRACRTAAEDGCAPEDFNGIVAAYAATDSGFLALSGRSTFTGSGVL
jgi:hypothetical protein